MTDYKLKRLGKNMSRLFNGVDLRDLKMEAIDGEKHIEREYTAYAKVKDFNWLDDAPEHEHHLQWNIDYGKESKVRGRLRLINNRRYTEAIKEPLVGEEGCYEVEFDIPRDAFEMKKKACKDGYSKDRYSFPIDGSNLKWEIDVFKSKSGGRSEWIKIDLEYDSKDRVDFNLPIEVSELFIVGRDSSQEARDMASQLWDDEWLKLDHTTARGGLL